MGLLKSLFGDANTKFVKDAQGALEKSKLFEEKILGLSPEALAASFLQLRDRHLNKGEPLDSLLPEAFAHVRVASQQTLKQRHYDVQLIGAMVLHKGMIAEMKTGEGKTLVATLSVALNALTQKGVHVVTVNDYLAHRDAQWMGAIYHRLGLSIGIIQHDSAFIYDPQGQNPDESLKFLKPVTRREAYACDITYGTNNEFGFDYLRDNMAPSLEQTVQRDLHYAIIDEVDSILIDEARTPLIISAPSSESSEKYYSYARHVQLLSEGTDYNIDEKMRATTLTEEGIRKMEKALGVENIYTAGGMEMAHHVEQALRAKTLFKLDKDYVVKDGEVIIVDEFTGRLMFGRRYSEGLHQAIEAKEGVKIQQESQTLATITFQNYFRLYKKISGMTGTAATEAEEFKKIYNLDVVTVPTNRDMVRNDSTDKIFKTEQGKYFAVIQDIKSRNEQGQPILVGTISIEKNELLSSLLSREGIKHELLNAKNHEREARIITEAGKKGAVTIATNMAGRGVDIVLGGTNATKEMSQEVKDLGGLHVIGTERHESRRIDNQLRGRAGRQGDPGSSQFYVSLEDDLMRIFGSDRMKSMMDRLGVPETMPIENSLISKSIESAQKKVEGHNFDIRKHLVEYDDVINKHREVIYKRRKKVLLSSSDPEGTRKEIMNMIHEEIERVVSFHTSHDDPSTWDLDEIYEVLDTIFPAMLQTRMKLDEIVQKNKSDAPEQHGLRDSIVRHCLRLADVAYEQFEQKVGNPETVRTIERAVTLRAIDSLWIEHLSQMDYLRQGIGLRGYGQKDPLVEYKKEAFALFSELIENIRHQVVYSIYKITVAQEPQGIQPMAMQFSAPAKVATSSATSSLQAPTSTSTAPAQDTTPDGKKIGRNDPCWCGSGKKFKKCHGK